MRAESEKIVQRTQRQGALLAGLDEEEFDNLYRLFISLDTERQDGTTLQVVDRGGPNLNDFTMLMEGMQLSHIGEHAPKMLFNLLDSDRNGFLSLKELVHGIAVLRPRAGASQRLQWLFDNFDRDKEGFLDMEELRELVQFLCIMQSMQHVPSKAPVIWETQRWWVIGGWKPTFSTKGLALTDQCYADQFGEGVSSPQPKYGWTVHRHKAFTDVDGWKYAVTLPSYEEMSEHISDTVYSPEQGAGKIVRWRAWKNVLARKIMKHVYGNVVPAEPTLNFEQFKACVGEKFPVVVEAFHHTVEP